MLKNGPVPPARLAAALLASSLAASPAVPVRVRPVRAHRGLPHSFHDQAVHSLATLHPETVFFERTRTGRHGGVLYALVAWKTARRAAHMTVGAVAVEGTRAWALEAAAPAADHAAAREAVMAEIAALARAAPPLAEVTARTGGTPLPVVGADSGLLWDLEVLLASCGLAAAVPEPLAQPDLAVQVRYEEPRALGLAPARPGGGTPGGLLVREVHLVADASRNTGWPLLSVRHDGGTTGLAKCDGGATLRLLCRPELRAHAPRTVTAGCTLLGGEGRRE